MSSQTFRHSLAIVTCLCLCGRVVGQQVPRPSSGTPRMEISGTDWNFGEAWQGAPLKHDVTIKNVGDAPLEILKVKTSCGCTTPTKVKSPLVPGESDVMTISYNSAKRIGRANQTITVETNDPTQRSVAIKLRGTVKPVYAIEPRDGLIFGQLPRKSAQSREVQIINKYPEKMFLKLKDGQDFGPFAIKLEELEPGLRYALSATTKPPIGVGRHKAVVELITTNPLVPHITALAYGFVQPPVSVRPAKLFWPKNYPAEMKRLLRVTSTPDTKIHITEVKASHPAISVTLREPKSGTETESGQSFEIEVTLPPGDRVPDGADPIIEIRTDAADSAYQCLRVPIQVIGKRKRPAGQQPGVVEKGPAGLGG